MHCIVYESRVPGVLGRGADLLAFEARGLARDVHEQIDREAIVRAPNPGYVLSHRGGVQPFVQADAWTIGSTDQDVAAGHARSGIIDAVDLEVARADSNVGIDFRELVSRGVAFVGP